MAELPNFQVAFDEGKPLVHIPYITDQKEDKILFLFPDIPFWFCADAATQRLLDLCDGINTLAEVAAGLHVEPQDLVETLQFLMEGRVVYYADEKPVFDHPMPEKHKIYSVILAVTQACNLRCTVCFSRSGEALPNELSAQEWASAVQQLVPFVGKGFQIGGGEPLLVLDKVCAILDYLKSVKMGAAITTNGTLITEDVAKRLARYDNLVMQVALDGATEESQAWNRGAGTYSRVLEGAKILVDHGLRVNLSMLLTEKSVDDIEAMFPLARHLNVDYLRIAPFLFVGRAVDNNAKVITTHRVIDRFYAIIKQNPSYAQFFAKTEFATKLWDVRYLNARPNCGLGSRNVAINSDGNVYPCEMLMVPRFRLGNLRTESFEHIWYNSPVAQEVRALHVDKDNAKCAACDVRYFCGGGCKGITYCVTGDVRNDFPDCEDMRTLYYKLMWLLAEDPDFMKEVMDVQTEGYLD